jgi:hypothetical protein
MNSISHEPHSAFPAAYAKAYELLLDACASGSAPSRHSAGAVLDGFVFLCHLQSAGYLCADTDFLRRGFAPYKNKPRGGEYHRRVLQPLVRALAGARGPGAELLGAGIARAGHPALGNRVYQHLLEILWDPFEYTLDERAPAGARAAVGPDMPGAAFETAVLPMLQPSGNNTRRSTGSYYTSRAVVRFMCRQALGEYLASHLGRDAAGRAQMHDARVCAAAFLDLADPDSQSAPSAHETIGKLITKKQAGSMLQALKNCRVCDPASGAGAFLVGMLNLMQAAASLLHRRILGAEMPDCETAALARHFIGERLYGVDIQQQAARLCAMRLWLALLHASPTPAPGAPDTPAPLPPLNHNIARGDSLLQELETRPPHGAPPFSWRENFDRVFREKGGFDILIGNPPYGFRGVLDAHTRRILRVELGIAFPSGDIAEPFITHLPHLAGNAHCVQVFIVPKKSLYGRSWARVRAFWSRARVLCLADAGKAFPGVLLEQAVFALAHGAEPAQASSDSKDTAPAAHIEIASLAPGARALQSHGRFPAETIFHPDTGAAHIYRGIAGGRLARTILDNAHPPGKSPVRACIGLTGVTSYLTREPEPGSLPCIKGADIRRWGLNSERYLRAQALGRAAPHILLRHTGPAEKVVAQKIIAYIGRPQPHIKITAMVDRARRAAHDTAILVTCADPAVTAPVLCAWLNSTLVSWYAWNITYNRAVRTMDLLEYYLRQIPFPRHIPAQARRALQTLAAQAESGNDVQADIDEIICSLFGIKPGQLF